MDFDLRLLRHCRALAEEGSFAKAARVLHITQPALSRSIRDLEERVGILIFDRTRARVIPTDLGRTFLDRAGALLAHAESLDREVAALRGSATGALHVGVGTDPNSLFMGRAVATVLAENRDAALRISTGNWADLVGMLRRREVDIAVARPPGEADAADLDVTPLAVRNGYLFARPGHPLLRHAHPTLADAAAYPVATGARAGANIAEILRRSRPAPRPGRPTPDFACESLEIMRWVVRTTDHLLLASFSMVADELRRRELVPVPLAEPQISAPFAVMRLRNRSLPAVAEHLVAAIIMADRLSNEAERPLEAEWQRKWTQTPARAVRPPAGPRRVAAPD